MQIRRKKRKLGFSPLCSGIFTAPLPDLRLSPGKVKEKSRYALFVIRCVRF